MVVLKKAKDPEANLLQDITREGDQFTLHFAKAIEKEAKDIGIHFATWTFQDSPNYGSPENDKTQLSLRSIALGKDAKTVILKTEPLDNDEKNRVYLFRTGDLPFTKKDSFEAFYSIVGK